MVIHNRNRIIQASDADGCSQITTKYQFPGDYSVLTTKVYHISMIVCKRRDQIMNALNRNTSFHSAVHFMFFSSSSSQNAFKGSREREKRCQITKILTASPNYSCSWEEGSISNEDSTSRSSKNEFNLNKRTQWWASQTYPTVHKGYLFIIKIILWGVKGPTCVIRSINHSCCDTEFTLHQLIWNQDCLNITQNETDLIKLISAGILNQSNLGLNWSTP